MFNDFQQICYPQASVEECKYVVKDKETKKFDWKFFSADESKNKSIYEHEHITQ